jgi:DNA helicase-2/ATP-dependent DNA helicase PcrA
MGFYADLHVHSRFSRATSRDADLEHMALWARRKGVQVLATGDFTHPGWLAEIEAKLVPAEPGLFRLRPEVEREVERGFGVSDPAPVRFLLEVEISTIYKKGDRTRKVHHLIYAPDLEAARRLRDALARIGNIASDGRPILGLDSRHLLEIVLEAGEGCYLIPAHIWTPWFAVLGSKSGFDSVEDCYGDLAPEIFAVETGLSSDPEMNRRLSSLDRYRLVSNSDAHSPPRIGREACVFETDFDYFAMRRALETGEGWGGTVEFFAEEGKYHLDGHRKCGVSLTPDETRKQGGRCPACGEPLTLGVLHRVLELADREDGAETADPAPFRSLVPLDEVLAEVEGVGAGSKAVARTYAALVARLGPELFILEKAPLDDVERAGSSAVREALARMRAGRVIREPGFDGQYGVIRLFEEGELARRAHAGRFFDFIEEEPGGRGEGRGERQSEEREREGEGEGRQGKRQGKRQREGQSGEEGQRERQGETQRERQRETQRERQRERERQGERDMERQGEKQGEDEAETMRQGETPGLLDALDPEQRRAAEITEGPLAIIAGPGTGKTRTLTHRLAHLVLDCGVSPERCLAITFTRRSAVEMRERLEGLLRACSSRVPVVTFHALGLSILREHAPALGLPASFRVAGERQVREAIQEATARGEIEETEAPAERGKAPMSPAVSDALRRRGLVAVDGLIDLPLRLFRERPDLVEAYGRRHSHVSVDEYQDIDRRQYEFLRRLVPPGGNLCVIGDPDQAIYGFRGADPGLFAAFERDFPGARTVSLARNYRSTPAIVGASLQMIAPATRAAGRRLDARGEGPARIDVLAAASDRAEAELVVREIERLVGGSTFFAIDSGRVAPHEGEALSFGDFAVLYRTAAQADVIVEALSRSGIPFQKRTHRPLADEPAIAALARAVEAAPGSPGLVPDLLEQAAGDARPLHPEIDAHLPALRALAARHRADPAGFLAALSLGLDADLWDPRAEGISLLTLHAAKGLEFPVVFIVGCEDGILPLRFGPEGDAADLAEERRLFFVGMTRARRRLLLTRAMRRAWRGRVRELPPSPFLEAIDERLLAAAESPGRTSRAAALRQLTFFDP